MYINLLLKCIILFYCRILMLESHMVSKKSEDGADLYILAGHEASYWNILLIKLLCQICL